MVYISSKKEKFFEMVKKSTQESYQKKIKEALRAKILDGKRYKDVCTQFSISERTLRRAIESLRDLCEDFTLRDARLVRSALKTFTVGKEGRPRYLSPMGIKSLVVFIHTMDIIGLPQTTESLRDAARKLRAWEKGVPIDSLKLPDSKTINSILKDELPRRKRVRKGIAVRASKATEKFLGPFFKKYGDLLEEFNFQPEHM